MAIITLQPDLPDETISHRRKVVLRYCTQIISGATASEAVAAVAIEMKITKNYVRAELSRARKKEEL